METNTSSRQANRKANSPMTLKVYRVHVWTGKRENDPSGVWNVAHTLDSETQATDWVSEYLNRDGKLAFYSVEVLPVNTN